MSRFKDVNWELKQTSNGSVETWEQVGIAVLMDIRDELKRLNAAIYCDNALAIPGLLRKIERNTKRKPTAKKGAAR